MAKSRISVTIPEKVLRAADTFAAVERRSRSWVVTEAVTAYTAPPAPGEGEVSTPDAAAAEGSWIVAFDDQPRYLEWKARDPDAHRVEPFRPRLADLCNALAGHSVRYLLVGSAALRLLGASRTHAGMEILIHPSKKNVRSVLGALADLGSPLAKRGLRKPVSKGAVTVFGGAIRADLLTAAGSLTYKDARARASTVHVEGAEVAIAAIGDVVAGGLS